MSARQSRRGPEPAPRRVLTDPRAIRALAHPARLAVLEALVEGVELTATACAEIAGLTPSAMSYHLRALEKWGFVERVESSGDARERPWRAVAGGWRVDSMPDRATVAATSALTKVSFKRIAADLQHWFARERDQPEAWRSVAAVENQQRWLTVAEIEELQALYRAYLDARADRTAQDHPDGARRVRLTRIMVPVQYE